MNFLAPVACTCFAVLSGFPLQAGAVDLGALFNVLKGAAQQAALAPNPVSLENQRIEAERYEQEVKAYAEWQANRERLAKEEEDAKQQKLSQQKQHEQDLRTGKRKPSGLLEAMTAHDAVFGTDLAGAPKIRPDGKTYAISGIMESSDGGLGFTAKVTPDLLTLIDGMAKRVEPNQLAYFSVKMPEILKAQFYETAKINKPFSIIGRYSANAGYTTVSGQAKTMPVFEAVYWQPN